MAVYKGVAYSSTTVAGGTRFFSMAVGNTKTPSVLSDHGSWENVPSASGSVNFVITQSTTGTLPPAAPNSYIARLYHSDTNILVAEGSNAGGTNGVYVITLYVTDTGLNGGVPLVGDFRLVLIASLSGVSGYTADSDVQNTKGILRLNPSSMTVQMWHSGAADPASYGDNIEVNIDLSHSPGVERPHRHFDVRAIDTSTAVQYAVQRTAGTDPQNALMKVNNRFPAQQVSVNIDVEVVAVPSAIAPDSDPTATWVVIPSTTADRVDATRVRKGPVPVDATLWLNHHLQVNSNTYNPALDQDSRLASDLGFVTTLVTNSRSNAISGISYRSVMRDAQNLVPPAIDRTVTTGANGMPPTMAVWNSALPGGLWFHEGTITGPSDAVGLEFDTGDERTLLVANPALALVCGCGPSTANTDERHLEPGMEVMVGLTVVNVFTGQAAVVDAGTAEAAVARFNLALGRAEFLDLDGVWKTVAGNTVYFWPLMPSPGDANTHLTIFSADMTTGWGVSDLFIVGKADVGGVPLTDFMKEVVVQGVNNHNQYKFDGAGMLGFPTR